MTCQKEDWKQLRYQDQETCYWVSSKGRVYNQKTKRFVTGTYTSNEYQSVQLMINNKPMKLLVHRLVATLFCPNSNNYDIVDHIDKNKHNNCVDNLRWVTAQENAQNRDLKKTYQDTQYYTGDLSQFKPILSNSFKYLISPDGVVISGINLRILKGGIRNGYVRFNINGKWKSAHRLVWETFKGPIPNGLEIDHIDGNRVNNRLANLQLVTPSENMRNSYSNGHCAAKSIDQYSTSGQLIKTYDSLVQASMGLDCTPEAISAAAKRGGSCAGYLWIWSSDASQEKIMSLVQKNSVDSHCTAIVAYNLDGTLYKRFDSIAGACQQINCHRSTIIRGYKAKRKAKGYYWIPENSDYTIDDII